MRAVVQRVRRAHVEVDGLQVARIEGPGLLVLVGVTHDDGPVQARTLAAKLAHLRILEPERSALEVGAPILLVSQFTLYADVRKGRRPSWSAAAPAALAEPLVAAVAEELRELGLTVESGVFGAHMDVHLVNDGPLTLLLDV
ncbi:MAG: D-aminoacyl-tRNA deacylase [Dermatophilaceae bacterium]